MIKTQYIRTSLAEDGDQLFTSHYISEVLPETKQFKKINCSALINWANGVGGESLTSVFNRSRKLNEAQIENNLIRPILRLLGNKYEPQVRLGSDAVDFCVYTGNRFAPGYTNTTAIIESKRYGRIENKYYIHKEDNKDEIYQTLNYLRTMNLTLNNTGSDHNINYAILTDGYRWRIYSKAYTHSIDAYQRHFVEFDLEEIAKLKNDNEEKEKHLKLFAAFFCKASLSGDLQKYEIASSELETAVTKELREQTFTALEYVATGIWRKCYLEDNPIMALVIKQAYNIDMDEAHKKPSERAKLLHVVYEESLVFLLRLLFVLYAEDRRLFTDIPRVIKGQGGILKLIIESGKEIGDIDDAEKFSRNDDQKLGQVFKQIDKQYNGGLFSGKKHPLLFELDMDDLLFVKAIDNLCRVNVKKHTYTVDFSAISERELGTIYESLLSYKLAIMDRDVEKMPSIVNKKRMRYNVKKGDLYLINKDGERKALGAYFTPENIVVHLVNKNLDPILAKIKANHPTDLDALLKDVLDIKALDPCAGSGHMILEIYTRLIDFVRQATEEMYLTGASKHTWDSEFSYYVRTQVARHCIYGVDINPDATELQKLILWMKVFRPDKAFEFFDANLVTGNSILSMPVSAKAMKQPKKNDGLTLFRTQDQIEEDNQTILLKRVQHMIGMPRETVEEVHAVENYWKESILPLQSQIAFTRNVRLAQWLYPEKWEQIKEGYDELILKTGRSSSYTEKMMQRDPSVPDHLLALVDIEEEVRHTFNPLHWEVSFPHVAAAGGFTIICSNPPWDKSKPYRGEFFSEYIEGYSILETADAKAKSNALIAENPEIAEKWNAYEQSFIAQNRFYTDAYNWQVYKDSHGKALKGDTNLYKVFLEKIYSMLKEDGCCGIVIPDNFNIDNGCTGLRHLILDQATLKELIMFENRKKLFDIHGQYKFNVMSFDKRKPRKDYHFNAGFYWYDDIWLNGTPDQDYIDLNKLNAKGFHITYPYSTSFTKQTEPDLWTIFEFRSQNQLSVFEKLLEFPAIGNEQESLHINTYSEFHMTNDSDLFNLNGKGWPLIQGGAIHHYNAHFKAPERFIVQAEGEERLAKKWKKDLSKLPDRTYRIAWRAIAQPTDTRSLISTILPRGCFVGNSLNLVELVCDKGIDHSLVLSGLNVLFASFVCDFYIRQRIAKNVNAFIVKTLPVPRDLDVICQLGEMAMPLYAGEDFDAFRDDVAPLTDEDARNKLIAKLDARVAHLYGLTYEEYQAVLDTFPIVDDAQKQRCLREFNEWSFTL